MMNRFTILLLFCAAVCASAQERVHTYLDKEFKFEISYPKSWKATGINPRSKVVFHASKRTNRGLDSSVSIHTPVHPHNTNLDSIAFSYMKSLRLHGHTIHKGREAILSGIKFYHFTTSHKSDWDSTKTDYYLGIANSRLYTITLSAHHSENYDKLQPVFERIINSFKIIGIYTD